MRLRGVDAGRKASIYFVHSRNSCDSASRLSQGVFGSGGKNSPITSNVLILIRSIKYRLIKKLIAQMETNSRDEIY